MAVTKGTSIFASKAIDRGTVVCDYHGQVMSDAEGKLKYDSYGDNKENSYVYQFEIGTNKYWVDAVVQCQCHPQKKTKGRSINHSRDNPNIIAKAKILNGKRQLILYAKRDIKRYE